MPFTWANILTLSRVFAIPVYIYALYTLGDSYPLIPPAIFGAAALTDFFDGYLARRTAKVTEFGKIADPLADRLLIISAMIALYIKSSSLLPLWAVILLVARDVSMLAGSAVLLGRGVSLKISMAGKTSTAIILTALSLLPLEKLGPIAVRPLAIATFYVGLALSLATGLLYAGWGTKILLGKQGTDNIPA